MEMALSNKMMKTNNKTQILRFQSGFRVYYPEVIQCFILKPVFILSLQPWEPVLVGPPLWSRVKSLHKYLTDCAVIVWRTEAAKLKTK